MLRQLRNEGCVEYKIVRLVEAGALSIEADPRQSQEDDKISAHTEKQRRRSDKGMEAI